MGMTFTHTPMRNGCLGICANRNKGASNSDGRALFFQERDRCFFRFG